MNSRSVSSDHKRKDFLLSTAYRYIGLIGSFSLAAMLAATILPVAVVLNPFFHIMMWLSACIAMVIYILRASVKQRNATKAEFLFNRGFYEALLGGTLGVAVAAELITSAAIAPGAVLFAATTMVMIFTSLLAYVSVSRMIKSSQELEREISVGQKIGSLVLFLGFLIGLPVVGLLVVSGVAGVSLFPFLSQILLTGLGSLILMGNMYTILYKQEVVIFGANYEKHRVKNSPMECALLLFLNTVDVFIVLLRAFVYLSKSKEKKDKMKFNFRGLINTIIGTACIAGVFYLLYAAFKGTLSDSFDQSVSPGQSRSSVDTPVPAPRAEQSESRAPEQRREASRENILASEGVNSLNPEMAKSLMQEEWITPVPGHPLVNRGVFRQGICPFATLLKLD